MNLTQLWEQVGRLVRLRFRDGEDVEVRLLAVDPQLDADLTYAVVRIHAAGRPSSLDMGVGATVVASTDDLVGWQTVDGAGAREAAT